MKKSILTIALTGLFFAFGTNVSAQVSDAVAKELETAHNDAIATVKSNESLTDEDVTRFVRRMDTFLSVAKTKDDKNAKLSYAVDYNRIAENYARNTGKKLPELKLATATD